MKIFTFILAILYLAITLFCYFAECTHSMHLFSFLSLFFIMDTYHSDIIDKMKGG